MREVNKPLSIFFLLCVQGYSRVVLFSFNLSTHPFQFDMDSLVHHLFDAIQYNRLSILSSSSTPFPLFLHLASHHCGQPVVDVDCWPHPQSAASAKAAAAAGQSCSGQHHHHLCCCCYCLQLPRPMFPANLCAGGRSDGGSARRAGPARLRDSAALICWHKVRAAWRAIGAAARAGAHQDLLPIAKAVAPAALVALAAAQQRLWVWRAQPLWTACCLGHRSAYRLPHASHSCRHRGPRWHLYQRYACSRREEPHKQQLYKFVYLLLFICLHVTFCLALKTPSVASALSIVQAQGWYRLVPRCSCAAIHHWARTRPAGLQAQVKSQASQRSALSCCVCGRKTQASEKRVHELDCRAL